MELRSKIIEIANSFVGKEEIGQNEGFKDKRFRLQMEAVGWRPGESWCSYFSELVWRLAYSHFNSIIASECEKLFSASCTKTYSRFKNNPSWEVSQFCRAGAIAIWQKYRNGNAYWQGHAGVVISTSEDYFVVVEGNSNNNGSRNGYKVAKNNREYNFDVENGLRLIGFIYPKDY